MLPPRHIGVFWWVLSAANATLSVAIIVFFALHLHLQNGVLVDGFGYPLGRDFVNIWTYGKAALAENPAQFYEPTRYHAWLDALFWQGFQPHAWSYPPHILLFAWPFGVLPYHAAFALWSGVGFGFFLNEVRMLRVPGGVWWALAAPVTCVILLSGQNGFFTAALLMAALRLLDARPTASGFFLAILTVKPQLGLLIPLFLLVTKRWWVLAAAAGFTALLVGISVLLWGWGIWAEYWAQMRGVQASYLTTGTGPYLLMMPTPLISLRLFGAPPEAAWMAQAVASLLAVVAVLRLRRAPAPAPVVLTLAACSLVVTPYAFIYDMAALTALLLPVIYDAKSRLCDHLAAAVIYALPVLGVALAWYGYPAVGLLLPLCALYFAFRLTEPFHARSG